jgi:hypothetical protein
MLTFTVIVEKYENNSWNLTTELNETQLSQMQWYMEEQIELDFLKESASIKMKY